MAKKLVRFDWAMKKMLRHKANFDILEGFLSELLGEEIKIKQILDSESNKETEDDKFNRVINTTFSRLPKSKLNCTERIISTRYFPNIGLSKSGNSATE